MKVSKDIQNKMHKVAKLSAEVTKLMSEVNIYFESKGVDAEIIRSGNGISLEELEYGNDVTDEFVEWANNDFEE